jgi:hypothetical protein
MVLKRLRLCWYSQRHLLLLLLLCLPCLLLQQALLVRPSLQTGT